MTFFENNRDRLKSHLMKFLFDDDDDAETGDKSETLGAIAKNEHQEDRGTAMNYNIDKDDNVDKDDNIDDIDNVNNTDKDENNDSDDNTDKNDVLDTSKLVESIPETDSDELDSDVSSIDTVALAERDIESALTNDGIPSTRIGDVPYRISIPVKTAYKDDYSEEEDVEESDDEYVVDHNSLMNDMFSDSVIDSDDTLSMLSDPETVTRSDRHRDSEVYTDFDAFYEQFISSRPDLRQLQLFNEIHIDAMLESLKPLGTNILQQFVTEIEKSWLRIFEQGLEHYGTTISDPPSKWIGRAHTLVYDMYNKQPILDYLKHIGNLLVLFDHRDTFGINEIMYVDIHHKALEPVDMKKYELSELITAFKRGRSLSNVLMQDIIRSIQIKQNSTIVLLSIKLYNRITNSNLTKTVAKHGPSDADIRKRLKSEQKTQFAKPRQPLLFLDDKKVYLFDYRQLNNEFAKGNFVNEYSKKPFGSEFIEDCTRRANNSTLCVFCKSQTSASNNLKTIYHDAKYGPVILRFCGTECFSDIEWKPKVLRNILPMVL